jgi:hypothetical protein
MNLMDPEFRKVRLTFLFKYIITKDASSSSISRRQRKIRYRLQPATSLSGAQIGLHIL